MDARIQSLSLDPLFQHGLPNSEAMESILHQVDQELEHNSRELEDCVNDILSITNGIPGSRKFHDARAGLEHMIERNLLEKNSCYDPEPEDITRLLKHVLRVLEKNPGCEEAVLENLLHLSSHEGLCLPIRSSITDHVTESVLSINAVIDSSEQANETLWDEVCVRLRRYFIECLNKLPLAVTKGDLKLNAQTRLKYIQSLCTLYPSPEVWSRYRSLRSHQLEVFLSDMLPDCSPESEFQISVVATQFQKATNTMLNMINEDFTLFNSGIFRKSISTFQAIQELYFDRIFDEANSIIENLHSKMAEDNQSKSNLSYSSSEYGPFAKLKFKTTMSKSNSLDSLVNNGEALARETLPTDVLHAVVQLVMCLVSIDKHVEELYRTMVWEVTRGKSAQSRDNLRGVLKATNSGKEVKERKHKHSPRNMNKKMSADSIPPPFGATNDMLQFLEAPEVVEKIPHEEKPKWKWHICFKPVIQDVARSVEQLIRETVKRCLEEEQKEFEATGNITNVCVCQDLVGGPLDYPRRIQKSVSAIMLLLDRFLPLAVAGAEGCFQVVRSAFIDTAILNLRNCHMKLTKMCSQVPRLASTNVLYMSLSSAAFIRNHLMHYEQVLLLDDGKKPFNLLYHQFRELTETLSQKLSNYHKQVISTCILHDAESHNWQDLKEFYESERCSFTIQMWNYHMKSLQHELWSICPPKIAQATFTNILHDSLSFLAQRYNRIKPAYKRTPQLRADITAILLCTSELLTLCSNSISKITDPCSEQRVHYDIHNLCCLLLASLAIVSSPLDSLYKVYKKGFYKKRVKKQDPDEEGPVHGDPSQWLPWIRPGLYKHGHRSYDDMQTTTALYLHLRILAAQPEPNWSLLMQAMLMKDFTLPIMILSQHPEVLKPSTDGAAISSCNRFGCPESECLASKTDDIENIYKPFFYVLVRCTHTPDALSKCLVPAIDRSGGWGVFDLSSIPGKHHPIPYWLDAIYDILKPFVNRILEPGLKILLKSSGTDVDSLTNLMSELPCGCALKSQQKSSVKLAKKNKEGRDLISEAVDSMVQQIVEDIHSIPAPLCMFFKVAQQVLCEKNIKTGHNSVGLQVLAGCIRLKLHDTDYVEKLIGQSLRETTLENIATLGECIYYILTANSQGGRTPGSTPRLVNAYMKSHKEWLSSKIEIVTEYFQSDMFDYPESDVLEGSTADFTELLMMSVASSIMDTKEGHLSLMQIYCLLMNNMKWFESQLDVAPMFPNYDRLSGIRFNVSTALPRYNDFNPLLEHAKIGQSTFDQFAVQEYNWDWTRLLQSDLGLSETTFKLLLHNRHEIQEGAYLEEQEKRPVEVLKSKFDLAPAELV